MQCTCTCDAIQMHMRCTCTRDAHAIFSSLQYRWETAEQEAVERRVAELAQVCRREESQRARLEERSKAMAERVEARRAELDHARRRDCELRMLGGLAAFVGDNFAAAVALQPARGENEIELADDVHSSFSQLSARQLRQSALARSRPHGRPPLQRPTRLLGAAPHGPETKAPAQPPAHSPHLATHHHTLITTGTNIRASATPPHPSHPTSPPIPILTPTPPHLSLPILTHPHPAPLTI